MDKFTMGQLAFLYSSCDDGIEYYCYISVLKDFDINEQVDFYKADVILGKREKTYDVFDDFVTWLEEGCYVARLPIREERIGGYSLLDLYDGDIRR